MLFDAIIKTPEFASNVFSFFVSYVLLPFAGILAGFSFVVFAYGFVKKIHLGEYYTKGEEEGAALMGKGLLFLGISGLIFIGSYFFLA